jgi:hypothetical protein
MCIFFILINDRTSVAFFKKKSLNNWPHLHVEQEHIYDRFVAAGGQTPVTIDNSIFYFKMSSYSRSTNYLHLVAR